MTKLEREFTQMILENGMNKYQYDAFKKQFPIIHKAITQTLHNISIKSVNIKDVLTLDKKDIKKASIKIGKPKTFIFCGAFMFNGRNVILLENTETIGTYWIDEEPIYRQLKHYKIGLKVRLERHQNGINMILPYDDNKIGLFENLDD